MTRQVERHGRHECHETCISQLQRKNESKKNAPDPLQCLSMHAVFRVILLLKVFLLASQLYFIFKSKFLLSVQ